MKKHTAKLNHLRIAPRKTRLVADLIRGLPVNEAEAQLIAQRKRASEPILKLLRSAIAGAEEKDLSTKGLVVKEIRVDQAPMLKRFRARARGAAAMIQKKASHVTITLAEGELQKERFTIVKPEKAKPETKQTRSQTPPKPRPANEKSKGKDQPKKKGFFKKVFGQ